MIIRSKYTSGNPTDWGGQSPIALDYMQVPFVASVHANVINGSEVTYGIEYTVDDIYGDPLDLAWHPIPGIPQWNSETALLLLTTPILAIRLNIQSITGELRFTVIQTPKIY
jgi:hypothetical protein